MNIPEGWQKVDRPWSDYPIGTKARQSWEAGYWIKNEHGWNWHTGATFPTPGGANQVLLEAAPQEGQLVGCSDGFGTRIAQEVPLRKQPAAVRQ